MRLRTKYFLITLSLFIAEVLIATQFSAFEIIRSYMSDFLVVILLYYLVKIFCDISPIVLSVSVFLFACGVETLQFFHIADVLGLPRGSLLSILIGNSFSWMDILMYLAGSLTSYFSDTRFLLKPVIPSKR